MITNKHPDNVDLDSERLNSTPIVININDSEDLRMSVIAFLYSFVDEGIDEIKKQDGNFMLHISYLWSIFSESYEEKKLLGTESSPMQRLIEKGTKNLRAFDQSELAEDIVYLMQYYSKDIEMLIPIFEVICDCVLYKTLAQKFVNFGFLKDIVR